jgi:hypothetical protein
MFRTIKTMGISWRLNRYLIPSCKREIKKYPRINRNIKFKNLCDRGEMAIRDICDMANQKAIINNPYTTHCFIFASNSICTRGPSSLSKRQARGTDTITNTNSISSNIHRRTYLFRN